MMTSTRSLSPISRSGKRSALSGSICGVLKAVQEEVHLAEQIRQRLGLDAEERLALKAAVVLSRLALLLEVLEGFDEEAAGACGRIEDGLAEARD